MTSTSTVITTIDKTGWARIESRASVPLSIAARIPEERADGVPGEDHQGDAGLDRGGDQEQDPPGGEVAEEQLVVGERVVGGERRDPEDGIAVAGPGSSCRRTRAVAAGRFAAAARRADRYPHHS